MTKSRLKTMDMSLKTNSGICQCLKNQFTGFKDVHGDFNARFKYNMYLQNKQNVLI